mgnify:CR=1 FL=1
MEKKDLEQGAPKTYPLRINEARLEAWRKASVYEGAHSLHQWIINTLDKRMKEVLEEAYRRQNDNEDEG